MSILDKVISAVTGKGGDIGGLTQMLGIKLDDQSSLSGLISSLMGGQGTGGLAGLVQQLSQGGLGDQVKSWVGTGTNQPVTPEALSGALGQDKIAAFAHYETERREFPHPRSERAIRSTAAHHGASCGRDYAEPFVLVRGLDAFS